MAESGRAGWLQAIKPIHLVAAAGAVVAVGATLYYILSDEEENSRSSSKATASKSGSGERENIIHILKQLNATSKQSRSFLHDTVLSLAKDPDPTLQKSYEAVKHNKPKDPLEASGMSLDEFDQKLSFYQDDPQVYSLIELAMKPPTVPGQESDAAREVSESTLVEVHEYMHELLQSVVSDFQSKTLDTKSFDGGIVPLAAQALVSAKVYKKYMLNPSDIEDAVVMRHPTLTANARFCEANVKLQDSMQQLMLAFGEDPASFGGRGGGIQGLN